MKLFAALKTLLSPLSSEEYQSAYDSIVNTELNVYECSYLDRALAIDLGYTRYLSEEKLTAVLDTFRNYLKKISRLDNVVCVLGNTGAGKSTIINLLADLQIYGTVTLKGEISEYDSHDALIKIGHTSRSETMFPAIVEAQGLNFVEIPNPNDGHYLCLESLKFIKWFNQLVMQKFENVIASLIVIGRDTTRFDKYYFGHLDSVPHFFVLNKSTYEIPSRHPDYNVVRIQTHNRIHSYLDAHTPRWESFDKKVEQSQKLIGKYIQRDKYKSLSVIDELEHIHELKETQAVNEFLKTATVDNIFVLKTNSDEQPEVVDHKGVLLQKLGSLKLTYEKRAESGTARVFTLGTFFSAAEGKSEEEEKSLRGEYRL